MKVFFKGDCKPSHVKVVRFRHLVRTFEQKPLQSHQCFKLGHVKGVCPNSLWCPRCAEPRSVNTCQSTYLECGNCKGLHTALSKGCPRLKEDPVVLKQMVQDNSTHRDTAETVRRRQRSRRHHFTLKTAQARIDSATSTAAPLNKLQQD